MYYGEINLNLNLMSVTTIDHLDGGSGQVLHVLHLLHSKGGGGVRDLSFFTTKRLYSCLYPTGDFKSILLGDKWWAFILYNKTHYTIIKKLWFVRKHN